MTNQPVFKLSLILGMALSALMAVLPGQAAAEQAGPTMTLWDKLNDTPNMSRFIGMLEQANMKPVLQSPDNTFTVWAPEDSAFDVVNADDFQALMNDQVALRAWVSYHLAPRPISAAAIVQTPTVQTLDGKSVQIHQDAGGVRINQARVVQADLMATNGLIHVIDGLLQPIMMTIPETMALPNGGIFEDAISPLMPLVVAFGAGLLGIGLMLNARYGFR